MYKRQGMNNVAAGIITGEEADEDVKSILALLEAELGAKLR